MENKAYQEKDVQVLLVTMNMNNVEELLERTNIQTSFIIGNQCDIDKKEKIKWNGLEGTVVSRDEKGVGNNRNITLKYSDSKYCVLADDDMHFHDGYELIVKKAFDNNPNADVIIFNIDEINGNTERRSNTRIKKVFWYNYMNYGAARIVFRRNAIMYHGICFNTMFGGGAIHSAGEDSLFIHDCLLHGLNIITVPDSIAELRNDRESTWFNGYNEKYFYDKGVFLGIAHPKLAKIFSLVFAKKEKNKTNLGNIFAISRVINKGIDFALRGEK